MTAHPTRMPVAAALLVIAVALSCATACFTGPAVYPVRPPAAASPADNAEFELAHNVRIRTGSYVVPVVTADPRSIEQALLPALPAGPIDPDHDLVVERRRDGAGRDSYIITAVGNFTPAYAAAFARFAGRLRSRLEGPPLFVVLTFRRSDGTMVLIRRVELD